jgi:signal transduction histidine kinase
MAMATLGNMYNNIYQQPDSADYYLMLAIETVKKARMENIISVYQTVYEYYEKSKKYDKAYRYIKEYLSIADSLKPLLAEQRLKEFQIQYELEKKNKELELLEVENELQKKQTQRNRIIVSSLVIFICMLTIILIIVYEMKERTKKTSNKIKEQSEALSKQAKELKVLNDVKDKIFSILSHDMQSPIASLKNTFDLLDARLINEKEFNTLKEKISNQLFDLNIVLDNLLQWSKNQIQGITHNALMPVSYYELVERNLKLFDSQIKNKGLSVINNLDKNLLVLADFNKIDIVVRNLLSNAIKFTFAGGSIEVYSKNENGVSTLCIKDSGIGIHEEDQSKLFEIKGVNKQYGTAGESGTGLGLWLCKTFVEQNGGKISFTSESGKGSTFCISLPKVKTEKQS